MYLLTWYTHIWSTDVCLARPDGFRHLIWYHAMTISNLAFFFLPSLLEHLEGRELATAGHWISKHHLPVLWIISNTQSGPEDRLRTNTSWSSWAWRRREGGASDQVTLFYYVSGVVDRLGLPELVFSGVGHLTPHSKFGATVRHLEPT